MSGWQAFSGQRINTYLGMLFSEDPSLGGFRPAPKKYGTLGT